MTEERLVCNCRREVPVTSSEYAEEEACSACSLWACCRSSASPEQAMSHVFTDFQISWIVPVFPQHEGPLQCVLPVPPAQKDEHTILLEHVKEGFQQAVTVSEHDTADTIRARLGLYSGRFAVDGQPWEPQKHGCHTGMRVHFCQDSVAQGSARLRALPTPCRSRAKITAAEIAVGETTLQARDGEALGGACAAKSCVDAKYAPARVVVKLCLADVLPCPSGGHTSALNLSCTLDSTLEVLAHFQPERLCRRPDLVPELHPSASQWIRCLSPWDGVSALSHLTIYTDGSFASRSTSASWAVAVTSTVDQQPVFVWFFASRLFGESHHLFMGRDADSAFPAEMAALVVALAICASQADVSCRFVGDCTSALDIAGAVACPSHRTTLEQAMIDLHLIARARGNQMTFEHVKSHLGTPGNEFVDSAAKAAIHHDFQAPPELTAFCEWIQQRRFGSSWWFFSGQHQTGELPGLDDFGTTLQDANVPLPALHAANTIPGIPVPLVTSPDMSVIDADWHVRLSTYNVNTIKREADRQLLDHMLSANHVHIAGLQETRCFPATRFHTAHYQCFASADNRGNLGCQIWLSSENLVAIRCDGHPVLLDHKAVTVVTATARMLAICVPAGKLLFGVIAAHAPIEAAPDQEKQEWWEHLRSTIRKLPRRAIPVLLIDANARFTADADADRVHLARADGDNAVSLQSIGAECDLQSTSLFDRNGQKVVTWTSPAGRNAQIDYVLLPEALADKSTTVGAPSVAFEHAGIDHWPLLADVSWRQPTKGTRPVVSWDRKKLQSETGRQLLRQNHQSAPRVPWTFHVEDHLQILNDEQWQSIRMRRHVRRLASRSRLLRQRYVLAAILAAWRNQLDHDVNVPVDTHAHKRRRVRALLNEARLGRLIKTLTALVSRLAAKDAAAHTRTVIRHSRRDGPAALFHALRGVLRTGRRYKPPLVLPAISVNRTVVADPDEVRACLTEHFAEPEHGMTTSVQGVVAQGARGSSCPTVVALKDLPSVSSIVLSFLSMRDNKAAGISTIPSEAYKYAAIDAAHSHAYLYIKIAARQQWPTLWRGVLATAIPKPNKQGALLTSWRSIALAEAAAKGNGTIHTTRARRKPETFRNQGTAWILTGRTNRHSSSPCPRLLATCTEVWPLNCRHIP